MEVSWKGVYPAITTKFAGNDELDKDSYLKNLEFQLEAGIDGIILGGSLGEASTLTNEEKDQLIRWTKDAVGDRIPVIMNIAEQSTREAMNAAARAEALGADGLMLLPPMRYKADGMETVRYFKQVAHSITLPIVLYNNPVDYGILITIDMFRELEEVENIKAVKESTRDISNVTRMRNAFGNRFNVLTGVDPLALESLLMGADGWIAGLVCAFPRETVAIYRLVQAGRYDEARTIYQWFLPLLELDISPKLVQNIKLAESMVGLGSEYVREPRLPLTGDERKTVISVIEKALEARPVLPDYLNL
ncbi:dihydrodipicolinate synthase family protein [Prolixibacter sp. NT017]|uniref:dihydrodipicolinate synthase family protein n=1 Tax=Prolixibacter sp. NT017 TaxID=2652390 RepID=UPI0012790678|nr:dihydrodipicolinate synthase family protein [Prolixibacter sp. NT017]GET25585.1 dihydrodipicolinate synthase family protein [Prolixibacter sp. NT017]